jgi:NodT family efflux transporter outer membrane factor (OMF) lipoprotein
MLAPMLGRGRLTLRALGPGVCIGFGFLGGVGGCAAPDAREPMPMQSAPAFSPSGEVEVAERWWTAFGDADLNERMESALSGNFTLAAAWERLSEARAVTRRERAALSPQVDGVASGAIREGSDVEEETELSLGLEASYEVDLWGRIRSLVEAEELRASATAADYRTAAITLSGQVALAWYQLAEARQQVELIASQLQTNQTVLEVLEKRFSVGQSGSADVLRQRQLVEATREQAVVARARVEVLEHLLAVLEGRPPQDARAPESTLPAVPDLPATGLPSELLERRPDIRSAFLQLEASDADVAAAVKDQYPRIDLAGAISTTAENPSGLFENWLASLAGQILAPLIDGGRRRAEVERTVAVRRQRLAEYGQVVLDAFQEVEDALTQEAHQIQRIASLQEQLRLARSTYRQLRTQYLNGAADFLDVLAALREQQALERSLITAELDRVAFRIALYRALAGGFETPRERADTNDVVSTNQQDPAVSTTETAAPAVGREGAEDG